MAKELKVMFELKEDTIISFLYKNWKGKTAYRECVVMGVFYGETEYHKDKQFLLKGFDLDKNEERIYAIKDMWEISK